MTTLKLLLVDDDEVDRMAVRRVLRDLRAEIMVTECGSRDAALDALAAEAFDCVLLDYQLPGSNGLETLASIRGAGIRVPVVALTGQGDEELAVSLMKAGAADYLTKGSLAPERLERSLRYAIALHRSEEERLLLLEREQRAREEAQAANRAKDEFLATLSHELRTPLNAMLGWTALLAGGQLDEAMSKRALEIIDRNTRVQAQLIEDLLDISRIISGKLRLEFTRVGLGTLLDAAIESVRHAAEAKGIAIDASVGVDAPLLCDAARMQQVLWNLLSNAIKFTPAGGRVAVNVTTHGQRAALTVSDTGAGIAPEFLPYVFERFRQQDGATTREQGGLGLGLSIVRHIVERHGGTVVAASEGSGKGATFVVDVPLAPAAVDVEAGAEAGRLAGPPGACSR
jgi:signal transduction histidine kinase